MVARLSSAASAASAAVPAAVEAVPAAVAASLAAFLDRFKHRGVRHPASRAAILSVCHSELASDWRPQGRRSAFSSSRLMASSPRRLGRRLAHPRAACEARSDGRRPRVVSEPPSPGQWPSPAKPRADGHLVTLAVSSSPPSWVTWPLAKSRSSPPSLVTSPSRPSVWSMAACEAAAMASSRWPSPARRRERLHLAAWRSFAAMAASRSPSAAVWAASSKQPGYASARRHRPPALAVSVTLTLGRRLDSRSAVSVSAWPSWPRFAARPSAKPPGPSAAVQLLAKLDTRRRAVFRRRPGPRPAAAAAVLAMDASRCRWRSAELHSSASSKPWIRIAAVLAVVQHALEAQPSSGAVAAAIQLAMLAAAAAASAVA